MQQAISQAQFQPQRRLSPVIAGLGAAAVASAITLVMLMGGTSASVATPDQAATATNQCQMLQRKLYVSTTTGGGTVRLREGSYLSPAITLGAQPQAVVFPLPRPDAMPVQEVLTIEGNSGEVVITSDFNPTPRVFNNVAGVTAFPVTWTPFKKC